jgi:hypothetical protein
VLAYPKLTKVVSDAALLADIIAAISSAASRNLRA